MKRTFQFAAALVVLLMCGQPLLAAANCEMGMAASPDACPMGMSQMGPDCPMAQGMSAECLTRCSDCSAAKDFVLLAVPARSKVIAVEASVAVETTWRAAEPTLRITLAPAVATASSPPPYLLNRAFRI